MKKIFTTTFIVIATILNCEARNLYDQLCEFNFNWKKYPMRAPIENQNNFSSDREYIQTHQAAVLTILRSNPTNHLSAEQKKNRLDLIEIFANYRNAGNFPINYYRPERIPVFIDEHGTHCAVGYLMQETGNEEMAQRIATNDNYVWVKDLNDSGVPAWQEWSGLSFEELALIQGAYDFYPSFPIYEPMAMDVPQRPVCQKHYFDPKQLNAVNGINEYQLVERPAFVVLGANTESAAKKMEKAAEKPENLWFSGEGMNGVLNGKWIQNYRPGLPWIEGHFTNGKRSGQWKEYYQGTKLLCRTENWSDDKLNGVRTRFDRDGNVTEEILFADGKATSKINYDLKLNKATMRIPLTDSTVWAQEYDQYGNLVCAGLELIYNPSHLNWFANLELTALNSASINPNRFTTNVGITESNNNGTNVVSLGRYHPFKLYDTPSPVQYLKQDTWTYYQTAEVDSEQVAYQKDEQIGKTAYRNGITVLETRTSFIADSLLTSYIYANLQNPNQIVKTETIVYGDQQDSAYDSVLLQYSSTNYIDIKTASLIPFIFHAYGQTNNTHLVPTYYVVNRIEYVSASDNTYWYAYYPSGKLKEEGERTPAGEKTGKWVYWAETGLTYTIVDYNSEEFAMK
jgi:hypothetical protein